jgi:hypothetical protein
MVKNFATVTAVLLAMLIGVAAGAGPTFAQPAPPAAPISADEAKENAALYEALRARFTRQNNNLNAALADVENLKTMQRLVVLLDEAKAQKAVYSEGRKSGKQPDALGDVIKAFGENAKEARDLRKALNTRMVKVCSDPATTVQAMAQVTQDEYMKDNEYLVQVMENVEKSCALLQTPAQMFGRTWSRAFQISHDRRRDEQMPEDEAFTKAAAETLESRWF